MSLSESAVPPELGSELVSCLCVSENRVHFLRRAVACFNAQTYQNRELIIVYRSKDHATRDYVVSLQASNIRGVEVPSGPAPNLGGLRNIAVKAARGAYVATWDDDDWNAPDRLQAQMNVIWEHARPACVLRRCQVYDSAMNITYTTAPYTWQMTMVCARGVLPEYPDINRGEDQYVVDRLLEANQLIELDWPELYIYVYHGANVCGRSHFKSYVFRGAQTMGQESTDRVRRQLGITEIKP